LLLGDLFRALRIERGAHSSLGIEPARLGRAALAPFERMRHDTLYNAI
jgi:hypothetical protein